MSSVRDRPVSSRSAAKERRAVFAFSITILWLAALVVMLVTRHVASHAANGAWDPAPTLLIIGFAAVGASVALLAWSNVTTD